MAVALFHLFALALTARLAHWPFLAVTAALIAVILPFTFYVSRFSSSSLHLVTLSPRLLVSLSPLLFLYTVTALRLLLALLARVLCPACSTSLTVPKPFASWLSFEWAAIFSLVDLIALQAAQTFPASHHARLSTFALTTLAVLWIIALFPRLIPAGITGADPFAYVQMAVDLATRGAPTHSFPLADLAGRLNIPIYPTLFVGYTIPNNGEAATVWPPGFSALLALAFKLFGELGLYLLNPALACLCLFATFLLARRIFNLPTFYALLASLLLLTSQEQTVRLSIPLADLAVQLFTTLAIIIALRDWRLDASRGDLKLGFWALGLGIFSGLAFVTRYTQLLLAPGLLFLLATDQRNTPHRIRKTIIHCSLFIVSFLIIALPDFYYRALAFGSPFAFASGELAQFSAADVLPVTLRLLAELTADFNLAVPFILVGAIYLAKNRRLALGLALALGPIVLFHLPYHYLKLRDLLFLFPTLCALAALGLHRLAAYVSRFKFDASRQTSFFIVHCSLFILLAFRWNAQLPLLNGFYTYGFLSGEQRAHLNSLADLTPPNAVIAGSLNTGAVSLYAGRQTVRPGHLLQPGRTWTDSEWRSFVAALHADGRPVYLLMDSEEMIDPANALVSCCRLSPIAELYLPYYYRSGAATNEIVPLYRVDFK
ncbi:MAG: glycosyltransferase family 39 protein [Chloroflexi bacterium]|nr:glycosyltransferase family 39 protein [Chloroflexota bacterium]